MPVEGMTHRAMKTKHTLRGGERLRDEEQELTVTEKDREGV